MSKKSNITRSPNSWPLPIPTPGKARPTVIPPGTPRTGEDYTPYTNPKK